MRLLQIFPPHKPTITVTGKITGGAEKASIALSKSLLPYVSESLSIVPEGTWTVDIPGNSIEASLRKSKNLIKIIEKFKPDKAIYHVVSQSGLNTLTKLGIPSLIIFHMIETEMGISRYGLLEAIGNNQKIGGKLVSVSSYAADRLTSFIDNSINYARNKEMNSFLSATDDLTVNGHVILQYFEESNSDIVMPSEGYITAVARSNYMKDPALALDMAEHCNNHDVKVISSEEMAGIEKSGIKNIKYFDNRMRPRIDKLILDKPHNVTMDVISKAKALISTCPWETAGYTAFEAACMGVPSVLITKNNKHASEEIIGNDWYFKIEKIRSKKEFFNKSTEIIKNISEDKSKRDKLALDTRFKFTSENTARQVLCKLNGVNYNG